MNVELTSRKLSAILSADAKGYSRLMGSDEEATVRTLNRYRALITGLVKNYRGRVVDSPGDNILAEFGSVVHAVQCGFEIQASLQDENAKLPEDRRMAFRIGINLGDVIQDGDRIYGDGVNVAARMESLAKAGGICVSGSAYDQIEHKFPFGCEYLGEQSVKNITSPIRVYRIIRDETGKWCTAKPWAPISSKRRMVAVVLVLLFFMVGGFLSWNIYQNKTVKKEDSASANKMSYELPDQPSIAVLPFDNLSGDPSQAYIGDGFTEEIITALSKTPKLFVIARNSSFTYKGRSVSIPTVGKELGVRYVMEGSVRTDGDRLRITVQLIDAKTDQHLWAERYERNLEDIFDVQDEITKKVITELQVKLTEGEQARLWAKGTDNLQAYLKYLQGIGYFRFNKEDNVLMRRMAQEATVFDPQYSNAYSLLGLSHAMDVWLKNTASPKESLRKALELAKKAVALDDANAFAYGLMGYVDTMLGQYEKAIVEAEKAVFLEPNSAMALQFLGFVLRFGDRPREAIPVLQKSIRLDPFAPGNYVFSLGFAYNFAGLYEEAIPLCEKVADREPNNLGTYLCLVYAYSALGRDKEARSSAKEILRIEPNFSVKYFSESLALKNKETKENFITALQKAGLPD